MAKFNMMELLNNSSNTDVKQKEKSAKFKTCRY